MIFLLVSVVFLLAGIVFLLTSIVFLLEYCVFEFFNRRQWVSHDDVQVCTVCAVTQLQIRYIS